jgi:hypothetical protein
MQTEKDFYTFKRKETTQRKAMTWTDIPWK